MHLLLLLLLDMAEASKLRGSPRSGGDCSAYLEHTRHFCGRAGASVVTVQMLGGAPLGQFTGMSCELY